MPADISTANQVTVQLETVWRKTRYMDPWCPSCRHQFTCLQSGTKLPAVVADGAQKIKAHTPVRTALRMPPALL